MLDCRAHIHCTVHRIAAEKAVAQLVSARAVDPLLRFNPVQLQRQAGHRLHRRAGGVKPAQRLVEKRDVVILVEHLPLEPSDPASKGVGIERRHRDQREDRTGHAIDHHHRCGFKPAAPRGEILQTAIDGQPDRLTGNVIAFFQVAHEFTAGGHFDPLPAGCSAQDPLELLLQPVLANFEPRGDQQRIMLCLVIFSRGGADVARQMPNRRPGRVPPRKALLRDHAGHIGQPDQNLVVLIRAQPRNDFDRLVTVRLVELVLQLLNLHWVERQQPRQFADRAARIDQTLRNDVDPELDPVRGELDIVAIKDRPATRRHQRQVDPVAFGQGGIFGVLDKSDPPHPCRQQHAESGLQPADHHRAAIETVAQRSRADMLRLAAHLDLPDRDQAEPVGQSDHLGADRIGQH